MEIQFDIALRLFVALLFGGIIGWERERSARPAGLRTHVLVCVGSTLLTIVSIEGFIGADPSRVAAQIVSGIGFLGAGTILRDGITIRGLTTAASLWVSAGIGMAVGTGQYFAASIATLIVMITLSVLMYLEVKIIKGPKQRQFIIEAQNHPGLVGNIGIVMGEYDIDISSIQLKSNESVMVVTLLTHVPVETDLGMVTDYLRNIKYAIF